MVSQYTHMFEFKLESLRVVCANTKNKYGQIFIRFLLSGMKRKYYNDTHILLLGQTNSSLKYIINNLLLQSQRFSNI